MPFCNCIFIATGWESGLRVPLVRLSWSITKIPPYVALVIQNLGNQEKKKTISFQMIPFKALPSLRGIPGAPPAPDSIPPFPDPSDRTQTLPPHVPSSPQLPQEGETSPPVLSPVELPITQDQGSYTLLGKQQMVKGHSEYPFITNLDRSKQMIF